jgi:hypothetical protein
MNNLIHTGKMPSEIQNAFSEKVCAVATHLGIHPNWLMQVMKAASGLNPNATNRQGSHLNAAGLIQFTCAMGIQEWGETLESILEKSATEQLDLVQRYFEKYKGRLHSYYDLYAATFFPARIDKPGARIQHMLTLSTGTVTRQNPANNKQLQSGITPDFKVYVRATVPTILHAQVFDVAA